MAEFEIHKISLGTTRSIPMNVYVDEKLVHASRPVVECGADQPITIDKMYGPLVFAEVRITAVSETCEWVVERQNIADPTEWVEVARFPGQLSEEFSDHG